MKKLLLGLLSVFIYQSVFSQELEDIIVEKIPVTAAARIADPTIPANAIAYRVFVDMAQGYEMQAVFGDPTNELIIQTSTSFYNYVDGVTAGRTLPNSLFNDAAARFDSYITVGAFTNSRVGILTSEDSDGTVDGYTSGTSLGLQMIGADFETPFGTENYAGKFSTWDAAYNVNGGAVGPTGTNRVLIGQFTTDGVFSFEMNIQIRPVTSGSEIIYVAKNPTGLRYVFPKLIYSSLDGADPIVSLTSPSNNATFKTGETVNLAANATDADGNVTLVEFFVDGSKVGEDATTPYQYAWISTAGNHILTARATDNSGKQTTSAAINISATTPILPEVTITAPSNGAAFTVGSVVTITATASDADGTITQVEFFRSGVSLGVDNSAPYSINWTSVAGTVELTAVATDNDNNKKTSSIIAITVTGANVPPQVTISAPVNNSSVTAGTGVDINVSATDPDGTIAKVEFLINGTKIGEDTSSPYTITWTSVAGNKAITAAATDNNGAVTTSAAVNITVTAVTSGSPVVNVTSPVTGAQIKTGTSLIIEANASDPGGSIAQVEFLVNGAVVGTDITAPYQYTWTAQAGIINIAARATDNDGNKTTSNLIGIMVANYYAPNVSINSPEDGSSFIAGSDVTISADASDADGTVTKVEFYVNNVKIGEDLNTPYEIIWKAVAGDADIKATATDNESRKKTSDPVSISVSGGTVQSDTIVFDFSKAVIVNNHYQLPVSVISSKQVNSIGFTTVLNTSHVQFDEVVSHKTYVTPASDFNGTLHKLSVNATSQQAMETNVKLISISFTLLSGSIASGDITQFTATVNGENCQVKIIFSATIPVPPVVSITAPVSGITVNAGTSVSIGATASDTDGSIASVSFYVNGILIGNDVTAPYQASWSSVAGSASITARAIDNMGNLSTSQAVTITVTESGNELPHVDITSPKENTELKPFTMVEISADATDQDGTIHSVSFYVNDSLIFKDLVAPFKASWISKEGNIVLKAQAKDNKGGLSAFDSVTVHVNAHPSVSLTSPAEGAEFNSGQTVLFKANVKDGDNNVTLVEFFVNNILVGQDSEAPYELAWVSIPGTKAVQAIVTDAKGAKSTSNIIRFSINALPVVEIVTPEDGITVMAGDKVRITTEALDPDGSVAQVEFFINSVSVAKDTVAPYSFDWTAVKGSISITAKVTDNKKAMSESQPVNITVVIPYETGSSAIPCTQNSICVPVRVNYPISNVNGFDLVMQYDTNSFMPTGKITIADDLINPVYADYGANVKSGKGQLMLSVFLKPSAPEGTYFGGKGELVCIEFTKRKGFEKTDTAVFSIPQLKESYISGVVMKTALPGKYWNTIDYNFYGALKFWADNTPIAYDINQPEEFLITRIFGSYKDSCIAINESPVIPNVSGRFTYDIRKAKNLLFERDIPASAEVQTVINGQDALLALKTLLKYEDFTPSPYQMIAMDVNMDGTVSSGDISQINQRSVKMIKEFKQAWNYNANGEKIVDKPSKDWIFSDKLELQGNPSFKISAAFPESDGKGYSRDMIPDAGLCSPILYDETANCIDIISTEFNGVMLGDVNGSYSTLFTGVQKSAKAQATIVFDLENTQKTGNLISFPVYFTADYAVTSLDFAMKFNTDKMVWDTIEGEPSYMQKLPFYSDEDSTLRYGSYSLSNYDANTNLMYVKFRVINENIDETDFNVTLSYLNGRPVNATLTDLDITVGNDDKIDNSEVLIYPVPALDNLYVIVPFDATLDIIDLNGKVILSHEILKANIENEIQVGHLNYGVYLLKIRTGDQEIFRKIIIN